MLHIELIGMEEVKARLLASLLLNLTDGLTRGMIQVEYNRNEIFCPPLSMGSSYRSTIRVYSERGNIDLDLIRGMVEENQDLLKNDDLPLDFNYQLLVLSQHTAA